MERRLSLDACGEPSKGAELLLVIGLNALYLVHPVDEQVGRWQEFFGQLADSIVDDAVHGLLARQKVEVMPRRLVEGETLGRRCFLP